MTRRGPGVMSEWRCSDDEVVKVARGAGELEYRRHITFCKKCAAKLADVQRAIATMREADAWQPPPASSLAVIQKRLIDERAFAEAAVPRLLSLPENGRHAALRHDPRYFSAEVVWRLLDAALRESEQSPLDSVPTYRLACFIADEVARARPYGAYEKCRYAAWKELGWVYRCIAEYKLSRTALRTALQAAKRLPAPERAEAMARVRLSFGGLYANLRRYRVSLEFIRSAKATFRELGSESCVEMAAELEAHVLLLKGRGREAADILGSLLTTARGDEARARICLNFANALQMSGEGAVATIYLRTARELHEKLGQTYYACRDRWCLAQILDKLGRVTEALDEFAHASDFMRHADPHAAVLIDLDRSEAEIRHGVADDRTYSRLRAASAYAIEKQLPAAACHALRYLQREIAIAERAVPQIVHAVKFVRRFIEDLEKNPHRDFVPPGVAA